MNLGLGGRHALVCGASAGIGRATATVLAQMGAAVTVLARDEATLQALARSLPRTGSQQHGWIVADMFEIDPLRAKVEAVVSANPVQILVHNTGGPPGGPAHGAGVDAFRRAFEAHLVAGHTLLQAVLPGMREAGWGRVVNIISTSVKEPITGLGVSNTIRGAVASWAKTLAAELGPHGITVNNVLPGFTRTGRLDALIAERAGKSGRSTREVAEGMLAQVPAGRFAEPEEIAAAVAFLASPAAAYVNGINLPVDGGRTRSL
ncbi:MAG TPA: SDR family oxidoreductase [Xanthomonadaceae bacterium]|nr:SDR family oxidoreductase [Xanthomonadaceae bacterium]